MILLTTHHAIATITLNHPNKHNILNPAVINDISTAFQTCEENADIKVILLNANGKHFCAGADLNHMKAMASAPFEENLQDAQSLAQFFYRIYRCTKPTICCTHGKAMGGGVGLVAVCDFVFASSNAAFCFPEVKMGLMPAVIAPFVTQRIGYLSASHFMLTAELFDAHKALAIKLADHFGQQDDALKLAETLAQNDLRAMQKTKGWLQTLRPITPAHMDEAAMHLAMLRQSSLK